LTPDYNIKSRELFTTGSQPVIRGPLGPPVVRRHQVSASKD